MSKNIERLMGNLLLEGMEEGGGSPLVRWEVVLKLLVAGGLEIGNLRLHSKVLLAK